MLRLKFTHVSKGGHGGHHLCGISKDAYIVCCEKYHNTVTDVEMKNHQSLPW